MCWLAISHRDLPTDDHLATLFLTKRNGLSLLTITSHDRLAEYQQRERRRSTEAAFAACVCLRGDPFERADFNSSYWEWIVDHAFLLYGAQAIVAAQIDDYVKYPPRQKPAF